MTYAIIACRKFNIALHYFHLYKPCYCICKLGLAIPTYPSRYLFVYREYTLLGTYNALLTQFLSVFHSLPIRVSSRDPVSTLMMTAV